MDLDCTVESRFGIWLGFHLWINSGVWVWIEKWICENLGMQIHHPTSNQANPSPSLDPIPQLKYVTLMSDQTCIWIGNTMCWFRFWNRYGIWSRIEILICIKFLIQFQRLDLEVSFRLWNLDLSLFSDWAMALEFRRRGGVGLWI